MGDGPSAVEFPAALPLGAVDEETVYAYELALKLHAGRLWKVPRIYTTAPAVGAEFSFQVPVGVVWYLESLRAIFTASGVAANRSVRLQIGDGTVVVAEQVPALDLTAGGVQRMNWRRGLSSVNSSGTGQLSNLAMPLRFAPGGWLIQTSTVNRDAGDAFTQVALFVIEVSERQLGERAADLEDLVTGAHTDLYPGLEISY